MLLIPFSRALNSLWLLSSSPHTNFYQSTQPCGQNGFFRKFGVAQLFLTGKWNADVLCRTAPEKKDLHPFFPHQLYATRSLMED
jgi:hypothetical protein